MYYNQLILLEKGKVVTANIEITDLPEGKIIHSDEKKIVGLIVIPRYSLDTVWDDGWVIKQEN